MALSILALLDNGVMWIIAAALRTALIAIWVALKASWQRGTMREELEIWIDKVHLRRIGPDGSCQVWQANPYWVDVEMQQTGGPVPNYLTLRGRGRTVDTEIVFCLNFCPRPSRHFFECGQTKLTR